MKMLLGRMIIFFKILFTDFRERYAPRVNDSFRRRPFERNNYDRPYGGRSDFDGRNNFNRRNDFDRRDNFNRRNDFNRRDDFDGSDNFDRTDNSNRSRDRRRDKSEGNS